MSPKLGRNPNLFGLDRCAESEAVMSEVGDGNVTVGVIAMSMSGRSGRVSGVTFITLFGVALVK